MAPRRDNTISYPAQFPPLNHSGRKREFNYYTEDQRAAVVYAWLKNGLTHREIDNEILKVNFDSKGFQSYNILHYLGLDGSSRGFYNGCTDFEMFTHLQLYCMDPDYAVIYYYLYDFINKNSVAEVDSYKLDDSYPSKTIKDQIWINNTYLKKIKPSQYDDKLLLLQDENTAGKIMLREKLVYTSDNVKKEALKDIYDFRCQVCGDVILKTGWNVDFPRKQQWKYLSADVHHILPLSKNGPDTATNMLCLCPSCHRKFHSGEFRLKQKNNEIILLDELLGKAMSIKLKHHISLY